VEGLIAVMCRLTLRGGDGGVFHLTSCCSWCFLSAVVAAATVFIFCVSKYSVCCRCSPTSISFTRISFPLSGCHSTTPRHPADAVNDASSCNLHFFPLLLFFTQRVFLSSLLSVASFLSHLFFFFSVSSHRVFRAFLLFSCVRCSR
jgi:hypothetical protein